MTQSEALKILFTGQNVFLTGAAGSGKTYVLNQYISYLKDNNIPVAITASTGIAATHMDGRTIHSWSGIALRNHLSKKELDELYYNNFTHERITVARVLIIDEISMIDATIFSLLDSVCRFVRKKPQPFGGLQIIICGDFFQLPPIGKKGEAPPKYAFYSPSWVEANLQICYLEEQYRQEDPRFLSMLNSIRNTKVNRETVDTLKTRLNQSIKGLTKVTKLYSHRDDVDALNTFELEKLETEPHSYFMLAGGDSDMVRSLKDACLAPEHLILKKGALVMFVRNNQGEGYVNGTLGTVVDFESDATNYPIIETKNGNKITARPIRWSIDDQGEMLAYIDQIPLRLAWAITIHKSQGMTLDAAEVNLGKAFAHGMGYVALSRVRTLEGIKLVGINNIALRVSPEVTAFDAYLRQKSNEAKRNILETDKSLAEKLRNDFLIRAL